MVFSIALRILADRFLAEETAQDVFLELHANLDALASDAPRPSLAPPNHRAPLIDRIRHRDRHPEIATDPAKFGIMDLPALAVEAIPGDPLLNRQLRQLVGSLPAGPRAVVVLRYQEDLTPEEIAEAPVCPSPPSKATCAAPSLCCAKTHPGPRRPALNKTRN